MHTDLTEHKEISLNNFVGFLLDERINMSCQEYILAIRSKLKTPKILYLRKFKDRLINSFNDTILGLHPANMDTQTACCSYIINYINKSNRGVSQLMREAMDEINGGDFSINTNYNTLEISSLMQHKFLHVKQHIMFSVCTCRKLVMRKFMLTAQPTFEYVAKYQ